jgi:hypothetical protein
MKIYCTAMCGPQRPPGELATEQYRQTQPLSFAHCAEIARAWQTRCAVQPERARVTRMLGVATCILRVGRIEWQQRIAPPF